MTSIVSLVQGDQRFDNVTAALDEIYDEIHMEGSSRILVKPNLVTGDRQLAATHVDAVRAVIEWIRRRTDAPVLVGEGTAMASTWEAFENYGYTSLPREYSAVSLLDFNADDMVEVWAYNWRLRPLRLQASRAALETPFRISVAPPKTHDTVLVTLGLKNMVMGGLVSQFCAGNGKASKKGLGSTLLSAEHLYNLLPHAVRTSLALVTLKELATSLLPSSKASMHQGLPAMHLNLFKLAPLFFPHLSILDGFEAMEGNGPTDGDSVPWSIALAGTDWLSVDVTAARLMGFPVEEIGYLQYSAEADYGVANPDEIGIVGNVAIQDVRRNFKRHAIERAQLHWHSARVRQQLAVANGLKE